MHEPFNDIRAYIRHTVRAFLSRLTAEVKSRTNIQRQLFDNVHQEPLSLLKTVIRTKESQSLRKKSKHIKDSHSRRIHKTEVRGTFYVSLKIPQPDNSLLWITSLTSHSSRSCLCCCEKEEPKEKNHKFSK